MSIIRSYHDKKHPYVMASKASAWDPNLDLDCVGLWLRILTRPDDWTIRITELAKVCKCDKKKIYRIINILIKEGYAYKQQPKDKDNKFEKVEYIVFEKKMTQDEIKEMFPQSAFGVSGFGESGTYSTNTPNLDKSKIGSKKDKEAEPPPSPKPRFVYKRVSMEKTKHEALIEEFGQKLVQETIEDLDLYADIDPAKFKKYADHASVVRTWIRREKKKGSNYKTKENLRHFSGEYDVDPCVEVL